LGNRSDACNASVRTRGTAADCGTQCVEQGHVAGGEKGMYLSSYKRLQYHR
jgi:hypothetical protein